MKTFSYKEFKNVPIGVIHRKYGVPEVNAEVVRQRVKNCRMSMKDALITPLMKNAITAKWPHKKAKTLYDKMKLTAEEYVGLDTFVRKLRNGVDPELAIIKGVKAQTAFIQIANPDYKPAVLHNHYVNSTKCLQDKKIAKALKILQAQETRDKQKLRSHQFTITEIKTANADAFCYNLFKLTSESFNRKIYEIAIKY